MKSLGAKFVETGVSADGAGGYARELTTEEKARQQEALDLLKGTPDGIDTADLADRDISASTLKRLSDLGLVSISRRRVPCASSKSR